MFGIVLIAHGGLARELLAATEHVVGRQANAVAVATHPEDDLSVKQDEIREAIAGVDTGSGVVVITDMFGGTPSNLAIGCMNIDGVEVVYGANLPLLVKLAKMRDKPTTEAIACAIEGGRKYIDSAAEMLKRKAN